MKQYLSFFRMRLLAGLQYRAAALAGMSTQLVWGTMEVLLYRVRDLELRLSLGQRIFGVGSVIVHSSDKTMPTLELRNIRIPREVKEMIFRQVEDCKAQRRMRTMEFVGGGDAGDEPDDMDDPDL